MRCRCICLFVILFVFLHANAQQQVVVKPLPFNGLHTTSLLAADTFHKAISPFSLRPVPSDYYVNTLGFFCKKELQVEKAVKFPLKFRLGSVAYTDKMEGKGTGGRQ